MSINGKLDINKLLEGCKDPPMKSLVCVCVCVSIERVQTFFFNQTFIVNVGRYSIHGAYGMKLFKDQILKAVDIMIWFKQPISHSKSTLLMIHQVVAARFCVSMAMFFLYGSMTDLAQLEDDQSYWPQQKPMDFLFKFMEHGTLKWCFFVGIFQVSGAKIWNTLDTKSLFPRLFVWLHWLDVEKQIYPPYPFLLVAYNIVASVIY